MLSELETSTRVDQTPEVSTEKNYTEYIIYDDKQQDNVFETTRMIVNDTIESIDSVQDTKHSEIQEPAIEPATIEPAIEPAIESAIEPAIEPEYQQVETEPAEIANDTESLEESKILDPAIDLALACEQETTVELMPSEFQDPIVTIPNSMQELADIVQESTVETIEDTVCAQPVEDSVPEPDHAVSTEDVIENQVSTEPVASKEALTTVQELIQPEILVANLEPELVQPLEQPEDLIEFTKERTFQPKFGYQIF